MKKLTTILITAALLSSCNKFIDIDEKGKVIPTTVDDYYDIISDNSAFMLSATNVFYMSDEIHVPKDEINRIFFGANIFENGYLWKDYIYVNSTDNDFDWNNWYKAIYKTNVVLDNIDKAKGSNTELRNKAKGEALAQRAYCYLMLVNTYAKHYNPASADKDAGVPLYLEGDINAANARSSVKAVYDQIEKDLTTAVPLLPPTATLNAHPSQASTYGLLAKMYLYQGKYEQARSNATSALNISSFLYDYNGIEFMPGMPQWMGTTGFVNRMLDNREILLHKQATNPLLYSIATYMTAEHKALYEKGDRRLYLTVIDQAPFGANLYGPNIWPKERQYRSGISIPDILLIRAECRARLNEANDAIDDLNMLRRKRINTADYADIPHGKTPDEALLLVLNERRKECFTECWRLFDLKRLNLDPRFKRNITRTWGTETITLTPESNNYVVAIPQRVLQLNKLIEQNPRDKRQ